MNYQKMNMMFIMFYKNIKIMINYNYLYYVILLETNQKTFITK